MRYPRSAERTCTKLRASSEVPIEQHEAEGDLRANHGPASARRMTMPGDGPRRAARVRDAPEREQRQHQRRHEREQRRRAPPPASRAECRRAGAGRPDLTRGAAGRPVQPRARPTSPPSTASSAASTTSGRASCPALGAEHGADGRFAPLRVRRVRCRAATLASATSEQDAGGAQQRKQQRTARADDVILEAQDRRSRRPCSNAGARARARWRCRSVPCVPARPSLPVRGGAIDPDVCRKPVLALAVVEAPRASTRLSPRGARSRAA